MLELQYLNKSKQNSMNTNYSELMSFDHQQEETQKLFSKYNGYCPKEDLQDDFATDGHQSIAEPETCTRSLKRAGKSIEISFEAQFFKQHFASCRAYIENYIEFARKLLVRKTGTHFLGEELDYLLLANKTSVAEFIETSDVKMTTSQIRQFIKDLEHEDKLQEFLAFICGSCSQQIASQLVMVSHYVWESYIKVQQLELTTDDLMMLAEQITNEVNRNTTQLKEIKFLNLKFLENEANFDAKDIEQEYSSFLHFYCTTVLFVIAQFFENPYYLRQQEENSAEDYPQSPLKRSFNQSSFFKDMEGEEFYGSAQKKIRKPSD